MAKTRFIQFRVTNNQYERIKNNAKARGFLTVSSYLRELALDKDLVFQQKFNEIYSVIVKGDKKAQ